MMIDYLTDELKVDFIYTGRTNQDMVENLFSQLRGKGGFNYTPSSYEIGVHLANIISLKILFTSPLSNCISDGCKLLELDWVNFQEKYKYSLKDTGPNQCNVQDDGFVDEYVQRASFNTLKRNAATYYAGYCIKKRIDCKICETKLLRRDSSEINISHIFINEKNFSKNDSRFGSRKAPSEEFGKIAELLIKIFEMAYENQCHSNNVCETIAMKGQQMIIEKYPNFFPHDTDDPCFQHLQNLIKFFVLVLMRKNCQWSVTNNEFTTSKRKNKWGPTKAAKKIKILRH